MQEVTEGQGDRSSLDKEDQKAKQRDEDLRKAALYTAIYDAYIGTLIEADKSILYISAGGVGLLVTLMTAFELKAMWQIVLYFIALALFVISIVSCIFIFKRNKVVLDNMLRKRPEQDSLLSFLDYLSICCCIIGIILTILVGGVGAGYKLNHKLDKKVETERSTVINAVNGTVVVNNYSTSTILRRR